MSLRAGWLQLISSLILAMVLVPSTVRADMGPPPGLKRARTVNRITSDLDLRESVLIVVHHKTHSASKEEPDRVARIVTLPTDVTGHYRQSAELVVVPRSLANEFPDPVDLVEAAKSRAGTARFPLTFNESVPAWYGEEFVIRHRLERDGPSGEFRLVRVSWRPHNQCCIVLVALPLLMLWFAIRAIRNVMRRRREHRPT